MVRHESIQTHQRMFGEFLLYTATPRHLYYTITCESAFLVKQDDPWQGDSPHGNYSWVPEFLQLNQESGNQTLDVVEARYPNLATVEHPFNVRTLCK